MRTGFSQRGGKMNIPSSLGVSAYQKYNRIEAPQPRRSGTAALSDSSANSSHSANDADQITLSGEAQALLANANNDGTNSAASTRTQAQQELLDAVSSTPQEADRLAHAMAYTPSRPFYSINASDPRDMTVRLASTGQVVDSGYEANFSKEASLVDARLRQIYESGKAKGTAPAQILGELMDFKNAQSQSYKEATAWGYA